MNQTKSVIIYHSKMEQMQDEVAQQFMQEHPDGILYCFYGFALFVVGVMVFNLVNFFRLRNRFNRF